MASCVQFADLPLVNSVDKLVRTTEHKQNDELTHHISRIKAPGGLPVSKRRQYTSICC